MIEMGIVREQWESYSERGKGLGSKGVVCWFYGMCVYLWGGGEREKECVCMK